MLFVLKGDIEFEAESIDDAFAKLAKHFADLREGEDSDLIIGGEIEIHPAKTTPTCAT